MDICKLTQNISNKVVLIAKILLYAIHKKIFGHSPGVEMLNFLKNLSWSIVGLGFTSILLFIINITAGRLMNPTEYGKYGLIISFSQILIIFNLFGIDGSNIILISKCKDVYKKRDYVTTSIMFVFLTSILSSTFVLILNKLSPNIIFAHKELVFPIIIYSSLYSIRAIFDSNIRALHLFKLQFLLRIIEFLTTATIFILVFIIFKKYSYQNYLFSILSGVMVIIIASALAVIKSTSSPNINIIKEEINMGSIMFIGGIVSTITGQVDKIIISNSLGFYSLGIYSAYLTSSTLVSSNLASIFTNVFLPSISKENDKSPILQKINKISLITSIPLLLIIATIITTSILLFGSEYTLKINYIFLFAILATLHFYLSIYHSLIASISKKLFSKYITYTTITGIVYLSSLGLLVFLRKISISSVALATISAVAVIIIIQKKLLKIYSRVG